jgi:hypothetical protein
LVKELAGINPPVMQATVLPRTPSPSTHNIISDEDMMLDYNDTEEEKVPAKDYRPSNPDRPLRLSDLINSGKYEGIAKPGSSLYLSKIWRERIKDWDEEQRNGTA